MRLAVTGASGFVGGAVARDAVARGDEVWTFSRRPAAVPGAHHRTWDLAAGPLQDAPEVDVVVHAGAAVDDAAPADVARAVNVGGTQAVRASFPRARLVHVSSSSVHDPRRATVRGREDQAPVDRYVDVYSATKAAAERWLHADASDARAAGQARGWVVVLRPHAVYGPGDTTLLPRVEAALRPLPRGASLLPLPGGGRARHQLTHVDTLVAAVRAAAAVGEADLRRAAPGGVLVAHVADAEPVVLRDVLVEALAHRGHRVHVLPVPVRAAWALAAAGERRHRRRGVVPRLSRYAVSHLGYERTYDLSVLRDVLGVEPGRTDVRGAARW